MENKIFKRKVNEFLLRSFKIEMVSAAIILIVIMPLPLWLELFGNDRFTTSSLSSNFAFIQFLIFCIYGFRLLNNFERYNELRKVYFYKIKFTEKEVFMNQHHALFEDINYVEFLPSYESGCAIVVDTDEVMYEIPSDIEKLDKLKNEFRDRLEGKIVEATEDQKN